nr:MFS transporter [Rhodococcus sp. (in: high G+C Gram-positive bacteria)]
MKDEEISENDLGRAVPRKIAARILPVVIVLYMTNYMDRANIGFAQAGMARDIGITTAVFGFASSIFFAAYVVFEIPSNIILKKVGAKLWFARIAITWGIVAVATGMVTTSGQLVGARVILGIAEAGLFPGVLFYLTLWFRRRERVRAIAALAVAQPLALILGSLTGGVILDNVHWFGVQSWRWVFVLQGLPAIAIGIVVLFVLPSTPDKARFLNRREMSWLTDELAKETPDEGHDGFRAQLGAIRNRRVLQLAAAQMFIACGLYGLAFFLPLIVKQLNPSYSSTNIGVLGAIPYVVGGVGMLVISRHSDRTGDRKFHVIACVLLAAVGLFGAIQLKHYVVPSLMCLTITAIGVLGYIAPFFAMASEMLPRKSVAVGLAFVNSIAAIGGFAGPFMIGIFATDDDVTVGLYFPVGALLVASVLVALLPERTTSRSPQPRDRTAARNSPALIVPELPSD